MPITGKILLIAKYFYFVARAGNKICRRTILSKDNDGFRLTLEPTRQHNRGRRHHGRGGDPA
jgi:hypothetical protein